MVTIICPNCQKRYAVDKSRISKGTTIARCKSCGLKFDIRAAIFSETPHLTETPPPPKGISLISEANSKHKIVISQKARILILLIAVTCFFAPITTLQLQVIGNASYSMFDFITSITQWSSSKDTMHSKSNFADFMMHPFDTSKNYSRSKQPSYTSNNLSLLMLIGFGLLFVSHICLLLYFLLLIVYTIDLLFIHNNCGTLFNIAMWLGLQFVPISFISGSFYISGIRNQLPGLLTDNPLTGFANILASKISIYPSYGAWIIGIFAILYLCITLLENKYYTISITKQPYDTSLEPHSKPSPTSNSGHDMVQTRSGDNMRFRTSSTLSLILYIILLQITFILFWIAIALMLGNATGGFKGAHLLLFLSTVSTLWGFLATYIIYRLMHFYIICFSAFMFFNLCIISLFICGFKRSLHDIITLYTAPEVLCVNICSIATLLLYGAIKRHFMRI